MLLVQNLLIDGRRGYKKQEGCISEYAVVIITVSEKVFSASD